MGFIKKAGLWLVMGGLVGTGFTGAMFLVSYLAMDRFTEEMEETATDSWQREEFGTDSRLIISNHRERSLKNGVDILGVVENAGKDAWSGIAIEVELFDADGQFVDECSEYIRTTLQPGDKANFKVTCRRCDDSQFPEYQSYTIEVTDAYYENTGSDT